MTSLVFQQTKSHCNVSARAEKTCCWDLELYCLPDGVGDETRDTQVRLQIGTWANTVRGKVTQRLTTTRGWRFWVNPFCSVTCSMWNSPSSPHLTHFCGWLRGTGEQQIPAADSQNADFVFFKQFLCCSSLKPKETFFIPSRSDSLSLWWPAPMLAHLSPSHLLSWHQP